MGTPRVLREAETIFPKNLIERVSILASTLRMRGLEGNADELADIFNACEQVLAAEFDAGYEHAQETTNDWLEHQRGAED